MRVGLTKVQHVHVVVAYRSVPAAKDIDLPLLHHTRRVTEGETQKENKVSECICEKTDC